MTSGKPIVRRGVAAAVVLGAALLARSAHADSFAGFSGRGRQYGLGDRACGFLKVENGAAHGVPACTTPDTQARAQLELKPVAPDRGATATFYATASGRTLKLLRRDGDVLVVQWDALDPIGKIVEVYTHKDQDRVVVLFTTRSVGREVTSAVGFDLIGSGASTPPAMDPVKPPATDPPKDPGTAPPADKALTAALTKARAATGKKAAPAWQAVLALDADNSEARYGLAVAAIGAKQQAAALAELGKLAASTRSDAIEFLVAARFDKAFAALRGDDAFRKLVGFDRPATTVYERVMGFGGSWEETGTSCDKPTVSLVFTRQRTFNLKVRSACEGMVLNSKFHGTWAVGGPGLVLTFPNQGRDDEDMPCSFEQVGDEEGLRCPLDEDIQLVVLPARR